MNQYDREKIIRAGQIAKEAIIFAKSFIVKGMPLIEIAQKIEDKIMHLGGKPAFPVNLSINEIAAHATPSYNDDSVAHGLLKVDIGVHIDGMIADTAFSLDLENSDLNRKLIEVAKEALDSAVSHAHFDSPVTKIGARVAECAAKYNFSSIHNLTGHSIEKYDVHAGISIPNYDSGQVDLLKEGIYAIEPFITPGSGRVRDGKPSGIYHFAEPRAVRDNVAREVAAFIVSEYQGLPFCSRWIHSKFGGRGLLALNMLEQAGVVYQYPQLIESDNGIVSQAEHTLLIEKSKTTIIT